MKKTFGIAAVTALAIAACGGGAAQTHATTAAGKAGGAAGAEESRVPVDVGPEGIANPSPQRVRMVLALAPLRDHPVGKRLGPLIVNMPQFRETLNGIVEDPVQQVDWVWLSGPSVTNTSKDAIVVHHALSEASIEKAIDLLHQRSTSVVPYDTGVAGVKATIGNVDLGPRVLVRAQPSLLAVVPPEFAKPAAKVLVHANVHSPAKDGEALRYWAASPHDELSMVPASVQEVTVVVTPRADGGADAQADGTCADEKAAQEVAAQVTYVIRSTNGFIVRMLTRGLLDAIDVSTEKNVVHVKLSASQGQLEAVMGLLTRMLGGDMKKPDAAESGTTNL